jgi:hypothetical protein
LPRARSSISFRRAAAFGACRDLWISRREELLLLQLHALPRRIPEHAIEPTHPSRGRCLRIALPHLEHLWELDAPVEERVLPPQALDRARLLGRQHGLAAHESADGAGRQALGFGLLLRPHECRAPCVRGEACLAVFGGVVQPAIPGFLRANARDRAVVQCVEVASFARQVGVADAAGCADREVQLGLSLSLLRRRSSV